MARSRLLCFIFLFSLLALSLLSSTTSTNATIPTSITIPLSRLFSNHPSTDPYQALHLIASASVHRALNLKHPKSRSSAVETPLFPRSYGGYSIDLSFGNPSQTIPFVFDTGSSLVWFPCTSRYLCSSCSFPNINSRNIPSFIPRNSSTSKILGCKNPKCEWILGQHVQSRCTDCSPYSNNCKQACPGYVIQYGLGSTAGILLLENLVFPEKTVPGFLVGCSLLSFRQPSGIVGFGRGPQSLPAQMGLKKFSYCLLSHSYDDTAEVSNLVLESESSAGDTKTTGLSYTQFLRNPGANHSAFQEYYYVALRKIIVGNKPVKIPYKFLVPSPNGNGGVIVDSGTTFTFMEGTLLDAVSREFERQMANYTRAKDIETRSGLSPCFDISKQKTVNIPELTFVFKGGAKMVLPSPNYFSQVGGKDAVCLTIVSEGGASGAVASGPAIILGNYQQQNYYVEYDLENGRLGFQPRTCKRTP